MPDKSGLSMIFSCTKILIKFQLCEIFTLTILASILIFLANSSIHLLFSGITKIPALVSNSKAKFYVIYITCFSQLLWVIKCSSNSTIVLNFYSKFVFRIHLNSTLLNLFYEINEFWYCFGYSDTPSRGVVHQPPHFLNITYMHVH